MKYFVFQKVQNRISRFELFINVHGRVVSSYRPTLTAARKDLIPGFLNQCFVSLLPYQYAVCLPNLVQGFEHCFEEKKQRLTTKNK